MSFEQHPLQTYLISQQEFITSQRNQRLQKCAIPQKVKLVLASGIFLLFLCYRVAYQSSLQLGDCIRDLTHSWTSVINAKLNEDGDFAYYFMVTGQLFVDLQMMVFIVFQMFKMENFFLSVWIAVFYGIRGIFLNIVKFPYPPNVYWDEPGFPPSIGVPYGVTSDYFYSGHTGIMLFSLMFWSEKRQTATLKYISCVGFPYIMLLVISSRVHYVVDVFAAVFFSLWIYKFAKENLSKFDRLISKGYFASIWVLDCFDVWLSFVLRVKKGKKTLPETQHTLID